MACCDEVKTQNDVADLIQKLIALLQRLSGFFDSLNVAQSKTQALGPCEQALIDDVKAELLRVLAALPGKVQGYINCKLGFAPQTSTQSIAGLGSLIALLPQLMQLLKYLPQIMELINQLMEMLKNGGNSGGGTGPVQPVMPNDYSPKSVDRCG